MKIDSSHPLTRAPQSESSNVSKSSPGTPGNKASSPAAVTHLSQTGGNASQDIDSSRVEEIRQAISEGRLEIRADRIADGLIDSIRDMLGDDSGSSRQ